MNQNEFHRRIYTGYGSLHIAVVASQLDYDNQWVYTDDVYFWRRYLA